MMVIKPRKVRISIIKKVPNQIAFIFGMKPLNEMVIDNFSLIEEMVNDVKGIIYRMSVHSPDKHG